MPIPDYTVVLGVDAKHLAQLKLTWPTWRKHKPSLMQHPMRIFFDHAQVNEKQIRTAVDHPNIVFHSWPMTGIEYEGEAGKWTDPQRYKMLAGFVYTGATVRTPYWLKIDTDTVASGNDDWINPDWFGEDPAVVSHRWTFTKPADQMMLLDKWVDDNPDMLSVLADRWPLNIIPGVGRDRVAHKRIISWCGFFETDYTRDCAAWASSTCGVHKLPVRSQDGFMWYVAKRLGRSIRTVNMKNCGWIHRSSMLGIRDAVQKAMGEG